MGNKKSSSLRAAAIIPALYSTLKVNLCQIKRPIATDLQFTIKWRCTISWTIFSGETRMLNAWIWQKKVIVTSVAIRPTVLGHVYGCLEHIRLFLGCHVTRVFKNWWLVINVFGCTDLVSRPTGAIKYHDRISISIARVPYTAAGARRVHADLWLFLTVLIPMSICIIICFIKRNRHKIRTQCVGAVFLRLRITHVFYSYRLLVEPDIFQCVGFIPVFNKELY